MSIQLENGYTKIANELYEAWAKIRIPGEAEQVLKVIIRKTYGFNKKEDFISLSQFVSATGLKRSNVVRAIKKLVQMRLIIKSDTTLTSCYRIYKDFSRWLPSIVSDTPSIKSDNAGSIRSDTHKRKYTKESISAEAEKTNPLKEKKTMKTWNEDSGEWQDNRRKGRSKPNPLREDAEELLRAYYTGFKNIISGNLRDMPVVDKAFYLQQAYRVLKLYKRKDLEELMPLFFEEDFYKKTNWAISTFLSFRVLNSLKSIK